MAISWRPKEDRLKEDMEKEDERLRFLREPWRWPTGGSFPVEDVKPPPLAHGGWYGGWELLVRFDLGLTGGV